MSEEEKKEEKITFTIQGKKYEFSGTAYQDNNNITLSLTQKKEINLNIGNEITVYAKVIKYNKENLNFIKIITDIEEYQKHVICPDNSVFGKSLARKELSDAKIHAITLNNLNGGNNILSIEMHPDGGIVKYRTKNKEVVKITGFLKGLDDKSYRFYNEAIIVFFDDGTLKRAIIREDIILKVKFHGKDYNLPFKNGDEIIFNDNKELSQACIDNSPERSAIVYAERLNDLEKSQEQTNQEVRELQKKVATRGDWVFVAVSIFISACCFYFALWLLTIQDNSMVLKPFADTVSFNKYTFFYEILKRTPIFISLILGFKFLQLAFERLRLIGDVEKVKKYLNLAKGDNVDNVKNNLLGIIAIPFFAQKKVKSSFFDGLTDKLSINIGSEREGGGVVSKDKQNPS